ncbi:ras-like protein family member 11A isoform X2 [Sagmatias obliquidens]|uniref:ras-like protein family member 11A isoform X2 n=1 Tax=Sagmatias obliquidens TaxID=3371155 RepID=UPI000F445340|nr:ras-like protein family member 11A isoform X2 [Lagenorhynchus obliquidens]
MLETVHDGGRGEWIVIEAAFCCLPPRKGEEMLSFSSQPWPGHHWLHGSHHFCQEQLSLGTRNKTMGVQDSLSPAVDSLSKCVQWAEGFLLVYSITDYDSYLSIRPLYQHIRKVHPDSKAPVIIVGNKGDLLHARQVQTRDGIQLANELGSLFLEISTSENYEDVCDVFQHLCKEVSKLHSLGGERRRVSIIPRPRSPNMQDLKRRFKQALSSKAKAPSSLG